LAGKKIAIKDNVCVAGVPMMNGSTVLAGYVPEGDATIVTLAAAYDEALKQADLLLMPTLPLKPPCCRRRMPAARSTSPLEKLANTCPFDVTGHPAITVPAEMSDKLPVGMMPVGRHGEDGTVLRAADAFQKIA
jgi:amidase